jgi:PKD repeat protein
MVREGKEEKPIEITLAPPEIATRIYPVDPPTDGKGPFVVYAAAAEPSKTYAGIWDDVYSSWSKLHGYVRNRWRAPDGSNVSIAKQFMDFVDVTGDHAHVLPAGVNFVHQSTTSMGHAIANGYIPARTLTFEKIYFSDCLVTGPAHASYTDWGADQTSDLYLGHSPSFFNSLGSSNSETMAITKMIIAGGYLPPATKTLLKKNGLYPAAILQLWKSALPYDEPYAHELRHRIAYKSIGDRLAYPEKYGATALDRGDTALEFHQYDDEAHMRNMVTRARAMDVALPEALLTVISVDGGDDMFRGRKSAVILQEPGKDITLTVSTNGSYDLQDLPLTLRWKLLYGNKRSQVEAIPEDPGQWTIRVPWDDALPEGRTAIALIANNGKLDSNPAILSVYRKRGDLPGNGLGPGDYKYDLKNANRRPVLLDVQDQWVRRGKELRIPLRARDPEGFPVAFYKRAGDVGRIDGDEFVWACPKKAAKGSTEVITLIASDQTSGNSYAGRALTLHVEKPALLAQVQADHWTGAAPLTVQFSAKDSLGPRGKLGYGWSFYQRARGRKEQPFAEQAHEREVTHTFEKPGFYEVQLTVQHGDASDTQVVGILVTKDAPPDRPAALQVEGNGVLIASGDATPASFDHTAFGSLPAGADSVERSFRIVNAGDAPLKLQGKNPVSLEGSGAKGFRVVERPRKVIDPLGSAWFTLRWTPKGDAVGQATVRVESSAGSVSFDVSGG